MIKSTLSVDTEVQVMWERTFKAPQKYKNFKLWQHQTNYFLLSGSIHDPFNPVPKFGILQMNFEGQIEWKVEFSGDLYDIQPTPDKGGIMALEIAASNNIIDGQARIIKFSKKGNIQWEQLLNQGSSLDTILSIYPLLKGGYLLAGRTDIQKYYDVWLIKLDSQGSFEWEQIFGNPYWDLARSIKPTPDGGMVVAAETESKTRDRKAWIIKWDQTGEISWQKHLYGKNWVRPETIHPLPSNDYLILGESKGAYMGLRTPRGGRAFWAALLSSEGQIRWEKTYEGLTLKSFYLSKEHILVAGTTKGTSSLRGWIGELDVQGNLIWEKKLHKLGHEDIHAIQPMGNNEYLLLGTTAKKIRSPQIWLAQIRVSY